MKVHEILDEHQLDEISLKTLGTAAKIAGKVIKHSPKIAGAAIGAYAAANNPTQQPDPSSKQSVNQSAKTSATSVDAKDPKILSKKSIKETATAGATTAASIASVPNPNISPGKARGKKSYTGSMTSGSGTKAPPQPKVVQPKNPDGTAVNALNIKGTSLFGGDMLKR